MKPRHIRENLPHNVYYCYDEAGTALYIGMSIKTNLSSRLASHRGKPWWPRVVRIETAELIGRTDAMLWEAAEIRRHQPEGNFYHTERARRTNLPPIVARS